MDRLIDVTKFRLPCKGDNSKCIKGGAAKYDCFNCNREITASAQDAKTASLVAQEIFKELEALNLMTSETPKVGKACQFLGCYILDWSANKQPTIALNYVIDSEEYQAIKSRWVKE